MIQKTANCTLTSLRRVKIGQNGWEVRTPNPRHLDGLAAECHVTWRRATYQSKLESISTSNERELSVIWPGFFYVRVAVKTSDLNRHLVFGFSFRSSLFGGKQSQNSGVCINHWNCNRDPLVGRQSHGQKRGFVQISTTFSRAKWQSNNKVVKSYSS